MTEFAIYLAVRYILTDAICPFGTRIRNLYHIATEQSGVISHLNGEKIYRTSVSEYIAKNELHLSYHSII